MKCLGILVMVRLVKDPSNKKKSEMSLSTFSFHLLDLDFNRIRRRMFTHCRCRLRRFEGVKKKPPWLGNKKGTPGRKGMLFVNDTVIL